MVKSEHENTSSPSYKTAFRMSETCAKVTICPLDNPFCTSVYFAQLAFVQSQE